MTFSLDPALKQYATEEQWKRLEAWERLGTSRKAAKEFGVGKASITRAKAAVVRQAARQGYAPEYDMTRQVPDGFKVKGVSTYYGQDGEIRGQWVKSQEDRERQVEILKEMVKGFTADIPREPPVPLPPYASHRLMACYPVSDMHIGMLSWAEETGTDYDMKIAEKLLMGAVDFLVKAAPPCDRAVVALLGDFMHYDSFEAVTPTSRNQVDADSRFPKMVRAAIRTLRYLIMRALSNHQEVEVIVEIGNHDISSSIFLMECLANIYENEPRVKINTSPALYHYFTFGKCLVGITHGHKTKMENLPLIMAADRPEDWGFTKHRYWWTGHIHHDKAKDVHGTRVESFRTLAPNEAYAAERGYRAKQEMKAIILHREHGEISRLTVNPAMLEEGED